MIKSLEGSRGVAALIVALYHLKIGAAYFPVIREGYLFVDLFFVLSGFVICTAYSSRMSTMADFRQFIIRRVGRLLPLMLFSTAAFVLLFDLIVAAKQAALAAGFGAVLNNPGELAYLVPSAKEMLSILTFTHSLGLFDHLILNTPGWSISTEFYTYFLFAAICLLVPRRVPALAFAVLVGIGLLLSAWTSINVHHCLTEGGCLGQTYDYGFVRCIYSFFLGALTYLFSRHARLHAGILQLAALALLALLFATVDRSPAVAFAFPAAYSLLVLALHKDEGPLAAVLKTKPLQVLGQRSYSIYLMHMPLLLIFQNLSQRVHSPWAAAAVLLAFVAVLLVVSGWTYRYVEHPWRLAFNRLSVVPLFGDADTITRRS